MADLCYIYGCFMLMDFHDIYGCLMLLDFDSIFMDVLCIFFMVRYMKRSRCDLEAPKKNCRDLVGLLAALAPAETWSLNDRGKVWKSTFEYGNIW